jgi:hypothetical protein
MEHLNGVSLSLCCQIIVEDRLDLGRSVMLSYILLSSMYSYMRWILLIVLIVCMLILFNNVTVVSKSPGSNLSKGALAGIILGTIAGAVTLSTIVSLLILRKRTRKHYVVLKRRRCEYLMFMILGLLERCAMIFHGDCNCFYSIF